MQMHNEPNDETPLTSPRILPNVACSPFVLVCRFKSLCPTKQGVSQEA